jgi:hypothetical protein
MKANSKVGKFLAERSATHDHCAERKPCDAAVFELFEALAESPGYSAAAAGTAHPSREFLRLKIIWTTH